MIIFDHIANYMKQLDTKELYRLIGIFLGIILLILGIALYRYFDLKDTLERKFVDVNRGRKETSDIISQYTEVLQQQQKIDDLLTRNPNFVLKEEFSKILTELGLSQSLTREPEVLTSDVGEYTEMRIEPVLTLLTMKQIVDLLYKIEQQERIYVKEIKITKQNNNQLELSMIVATFERKSETI